LSERKFEEAKKPLARAIELYPTCGEAGGPYLLMAAAHRELGETRQEREMLEKHIALDADAVEARVRLAEILAKEKDWKGVKADAEQVIAINPLVPAAHNYLAKVAEATGDRQLGIQAHRTLLMLDPLDRAEHHYQLARLLAEDQKLVEARREVVRALEDAPRYRAALGLLVEIAGKMEKNAATLPATRSVGREKKDEDPAAKAASPTEEPRQ